MSTTGVFEFEVVESFQRPFSTGFAQFFLEGDQTVVSIPLFDYFDDPDGSDRALDFEIIYNSNPFIYQSISFNEDRGILRLAFNRQISGFLDLRLRATDADNLSAILDVFISIRDQFTTEIQAAAGTSEKRVDLLGSMQAENVAQIDINPLATDSLEFPTFSWSSSNSTLELAPSTTPSRNLFAATLTLEDGSTIQRLIPVTFSEGEIFARDGVVGSGWFYSDAFGLYFRSGDWAYVQSLGWIYLDLTIGESIYFYSEQHGWYYTTSSDFPICLQRRFFRLGIYPDRRRSSLHL